MDRGEMTERRSDEGALGIEASPANPLIHNERAKLTSTYLNGVAIATFAIGALAPLVSAISGTTTASPFALAGVAVSCIVTSAALHSIARFTLRSLKP